LDDSFPFYIPLPVLEMLLNSPLLLLAQATTQSGGLAFPSAQEELLRPRWCPCLPLLPPYMIFLQLPKAALLNQKPGAPAVGVWGDHLKGKAQLSLVSPLVINNRLYS
jgi:hypothetical protein